MNKREYIDILSDRLNEYPDDFKQSIIDDIKTHINDGIQNGKTEEQIIENLGSVDELMRTVKEEYEDRLSDEEFGAQFYRDGKLEDVVYEYGGQTKLEVIARVGEVEVREGDIFNLDYDQGKFNLSYTEDRIVLEAVRAEGFFNKLISLGTGEVNVTLPKSFESVNVQLNIGDVLLENLDLKNASVNCNTGDVKLKNCVIDDVVVTANTGDIRIDGVHRHARIDSSLGDVSLTNKGEIDADISNSMGDVKVKLLNDNKGFHLNANSSMGTIKVKYNGLNLKASRRMDYECGDAVTDLKIRTSAGDIRIK